MSPESTAEFEGLLEYLKASRGFDFTAYKRASLMRRVDRRMETVGIKGYSNYSDYLEVHPEEFARLFNTILINVTGFYRDPEAWTALAEVALPRILGAKEPHEPIRVWSAGCASGQEAYTLAIVLCETLGQEQFCQRVKIYATDADEEALNQARQGVYTARDVEPVPEALRPRYFEESGGRYSFAKELRRQLIFGRHDLVQDAPISRIDLLACRNTLMYLNADVQTRVLARFHFALVDNGILFLGRAETLLSHMTNYAPLDLRRRIFLKVGRGNFRERLLLLAQGGGEALQPVAPDHDRLREAAADASPGAQILVDHGGIVLQASQQARVLFGLSTRDIGQPLQDLEISYRPVELRSLIDRARRERRTVAVKDISWTPPGATAPSYLELQITPLLASDGTSLGASITFADVTRFHRLEEELQQSKHELETATEELQSTNEELETTNEELQSSVEELETTNEELQSSNEELETMNEELQSTNEELTALNDELRKRSHELDQANGLLESILSSLDGAVIVVDQDLRVLVWSPRSTDLWGLRQDEVVGKHLLKLDFGLPTEHLRQGIRACLSGESAREAIRLDAINRRGRSIKVNVECVPLAGDGAPRGAILVVADGERASAG